VDAKDPGGVAACQGVALFDSNGTLMSGTILSIPEFIQRHNNTCGQFQGLREEEQPPRHPSREESPPTTGHMDAEMA